MSAAPARYAAYRVLLDVELGNDDLPRGLAKARERLGDRRDQALAAEIAIGTLRWRGALDYLIQHFARRPLDRLDVEVLTILRLAVYQIVYLTRVPPSAAVDEAVDLVRRARKTSATGFVNAVLRNVTKQRHCLPLPGRPEPDAASREKPPAFEPVASERRDALLAYFSVTLSHPRWLAARWLGRYGETATETWLQFNNTEAPLTLRANVLKASVDEVRALLARHGVTTEPTQYAPHGLQVTGGNPIRTPLESDGLFVLQDEASQLVGLALPVHERGRVLDACASPGGKTTEMAAAMHDCGLIVACDVRASRMALLRRTILRSGATCVRLAQADLTRPAPCLPIFDGVLLDAPCSGLGTLRRDPDIKWRRREEDLRALASAELGMLSNASQAVRVGGFLAYATCSSEPEENEEVAARFLETHPQFRAAEPQLLPSRGLAAVVNQAGHLRTYPHLHGLEAFFAAVFRRTS